MLEPDRWVTSPGEGGHSPEGREGDRGEIFEGFPNGDIWGSAHFDVTNLK